MNKSELIDAVAARTDMSKTAAAKAVEAILETIVEAVANGDGVSVIGFGAFKKAERAARTGKNPKTGEALQIAAATVPKFSAGATFKQKVAEAAKGGKTKKKK